MKHRTSLFLSARFAVMFALLVLAISANAATLTVTNTNDSGAGSLRQAIADAASGDTITFAVTGTITLTSGELAFAKSLTIQGPGANLLTVSGNNASPAFLISGGTSSLSGLTISNGRSVFGGGLAAFNCSLTISNCIITNNQAVNGGGLFLAQGTFNLINTTVSGNNTEFQGAGVNLQDTTTTMTNCTISSNASQKSQGGILNVAFNFPVSTLLMIGCTVANNTSIAPFGAIWTVADSTAVKATTTLQNTVVVNNAPLNFLTTPATTVPTPNAVLISQGNNIDSDGSSGFMDGVIKTCFVDASSWCNRLDSIGGGRRIEVIIPGVNANYPVPVQVNGNPNPQVIMALGCGGFMRWGSSPQLTAAYVSAQLSVQDQVPYWYLRIGQQPLLLHVRMPMGGASTLPATLSNGNSLTQLSSLKDLFDATKWALTDGTQADQNALLAIYKQLNNCRKD